MRVEYSRIGARKKDDNCIEFTQRYASEITVAYLLVMFALGQLLPLSQYADALLIGSSVLILAFVAQGARPGVACCALLFLLTGSVQFEHLETLVRRVHGRILQENSCVAIGRGVRCHSIVHVDRVERRSLQLGKVLQIRVRIGSEEFPFLLTVADVPWEFTERLAREGFFAAALNLRVVPLDRLQRSSYDNYLLRRGFAGQADVSELVEIYDWGESSPVEELKQRLLKTVPSSEGRSIVLAATLAARELMGSEMNEVFKSLGIIHLLVVSGFHIGVVYYAIFSAMQFVFARCAYLISFVSAETISAIIALAASRFYVFAIEAGLSAERALVMLSFVVLAKVLGRKQSSYALLGVSAIVVCYLWPGALFDAGFQLTYSAVLGLMLSEYLFCSECKKSPIVATLIKSFAASLSAWMLTAPVLILWFGTIAPVGILMNIFVVPIFSATIIAAGLLGLICFAFFENTGLLQLVIFSATVQFDCFAAIADWTMRQGMGELLVTEDNRLGVAILFWLVFGLLLVRNKLIDLLRGSWYNARGKNL